MKAKVMLSVARWMYLLFVITAVSLIVWTSFVSVTATRHLRACVAKNGYTAECLARYEMEKTRWVP